MNQAPVITQAHFEAAFEQHGYHTDLLTIMNTCNQIALAEQVNQSQFLSAEEAKALGVGNAEWLGIDDVWRLQDGIMNPTYSARLKYRAVHKEVPAEPHADLKAMYAQQVKNGTLDCYLWEFLNENGDYQHCFSAMDGIASEPLWLKNKSYRCTPKPTCQVRNLDTDELKTMTRKAAKLLQDETKEVCDWFSPNGNISNDYIFDYSAVGIYTYKRKANLVKLDGELMTRDQAIAKYESVKDKCDVWIKNDVTIVWKLTNLSRKFIVYAHEVNCEYQLRAKPLKQVSWKDVPLFAKVRRITNHKIYTLLNIDEQNDAYVIDEHNQPDYVPVTAIELAPAADQDWIAVQDDRSILELREQFRRDGFIFTFDKMRYLITGLAEGYKL